MLLSLVLALAPGTALARPAEQAEEPVASQEGTIPESAVAPEDVGSVPAGAVPCADSSRPQSAQKIPLVRDEELGVFGKGGSGNIWWWYRDYSGGSLGPTGGMGTAYGINNSWMRTVAADLNGDGYDESVSVYKDGANSNYVTVQSVIWHPGIVNWTDRWYAGTTRFGGDSNYLDIAAGNIKHRTNGQQDIVVAARNNNTDLEMFILTGASDGGICNAPGYIGGGCGGMQFMNYDNGRDNIYHVGAAVGDLDGDGWDDEIVAAFKDSGNQLQVYVTEWDATNGWHEVATLRYTAHSANDICHKGSFLQSPERGLDVTTGDVDADGKEEAIVAFVDDGNYLQVAASGLNAAGGMQEEGYYRANDEGPHDADYVSIAAPDLTGDGVAEIMTAYGTRHDCCSGDNPLHVWRLSYDADSDKDDNGVQDPDYTGLKRDEHWADWTSYNNNEYDVPTYVSIVETNPDKDYRQKALVAFNGGKSDNDIMAIRLLALNAAGTALELKTQYNYDFGAGTNYDVSAVSADVNNDSSRLTYTGTCYEYQTSTVNTVANEPPQWYDEGNEGGNGPAVRYGVSTSGADTTSDTTAVTYGASYTLDGSVSFLDIFEVGPSLTFEFEGSHAVTEEETVEVGYTKEMSAPFPASAYGTVIQDTVTYRNYKYTENTTGKANWVRIPVFRTPYADVMEKWNSRQTNAGWLLVGPGPRVNRALGKTASQSSTAYGGLASRAVDGNIDGRWSENSVTHTNSEAGAWWQVDLGASYSIGTVDVYNRTDSSVSRLSNYKVMVGNSSTDWTTPVWSQTFTGNALSPTSIPVGVTGRYVRIQLLGTNYLHIAEVQVWEDARVNLALGRAARQSSTLYGAEASRAVDGNTDGNYYNGSVTHSSNTPTPVYWEVNLGAMYPIGEVDVWNRTDGAANGWVDRLKNYYVKVYDVDPATAGATPVWVSGKQANVPMPVTGIPVVAVGQWVRIELETANYLTLAEVQVFKGRLVSDYPKAVARSTDNSDLYFNMTQQNGTVVKVAGNLKWDWCSGYKDNQEQPGQGSITGQPAIFVAGGQDEITWNTTKTYESSSGWEDTYGFSAGFGYEAKIMGAGAEWQINAGFEEGHSESYTWSKGTYFEGSAGKLPSGTSDLKRYAYCPYYYVTTITSPDGVDQSYMVLDYYVTCIGNGGTPTGAAACQPALAANAPAPAAPVMGPLAKPGTPVIASATHPDPNAWSNVKTATFTWSQPAGDPSTGLVYRWFLDQKADTIPDETAQGPDTTYTYYDLADGTYYLHVRAKGPDGQWSDTAHRRIRIDSAAPDVKFVFDPQFPDGNDGWYISPVTVTAGAVDEGSGVAGIEISTDGTTWQPYTAALHYTADTPPTTIWARATDAAGHVSQPVLTALKIDLTAPDSHVTGPGCIWGVCRAEIVTDAQGNEHLVLAGQIREATSGRAGMSIQANEGSWTPAGALGDWYPFPDRPTVGINWVYTATLDIGHGYHIFNGRATDNAGHEEAPYKIAEFVRYPLNSPDLSQSSIAIEPAIAKPGDTVMVTVNVRNGGRQESHVAIEATLPDGLVPAEGALASVDEGIKYDRATGVITWPEILLWQGQDWQFKFPAVVALGLPFSTLTARVDAHGFWPNTDKLPAVMQQQFLDHEVTVATTAGLTVDPDLPATRDVTAPHVKLAILDGETPVGSQIEVALSADADAARLYLREWTLDPVTGAWLIAGDSGWLPYATSLSWRLSEVSGVHYLGAWVADSAGNVSRLDEASLAFTNRLITDDLKAGQRRQYRFSLHDGLVAYNVLAQSGLADLYAWMPRLGQYPSYVGAGTAALKAVGWEIAQEGIHLVETAAVEDGSYSLLAAYQPDAAAAGGVASAAALPNHPLSMSTPLTGGAGAAPQPERKQQLFLPIIVR